MNFWFLPKHGSKPDSMEAIRIGIEDIYQSKELLLTVRKPLAFGFDITLSSFPYGNPAFHLDSLNPKEILTFTRIFFSKLYCFIFLVFACMHQGAWYTSDAYTHQRAWYPPDAYTHQRHIRIRRHGTHWMHIHTRCIYTSEGMVHTRCIRCIYTPDTWLLLVIDKNPAQISSGFLDILEKTIYIYI